ncbi:HAD family hydrolase [Polaribacter sp. WD7]|uniref:HAD family hydrolase n=1 Tax=Polaribacter sp. WD7 TaxID=2269061 RepID=UPI000DF47AD7|nr:HAD family hydrolase [Polaribacter sp. WD7]RCS26147.1 HAD family hydrolase [Polaribacter sp. WD7]
MKYKAVIFDLDGTLVNSIKDIADAMNTVLEQKNYPTYDYATYTTFVGSGIKSLVLKALTEQNPNTQEVTACLNAMMQVYSKNCTHKTIPYNGILELLDVLKKKQLKVSILSNKEDSLTKKVANALLPNYITPVLGLKEEVLKKPNPTVALQICKNLEVTPEETIYVGDSDVDILVAKNANMLPVGVSWGFRDQEELLNSGAVHILQTPLDLLTILQ